MRRVCCVNSAPWQPISIGSAEPKIDLFEYKILEIPLMNTQPESSNRLIRLVEVLRIIGLSRSQLYKMQNDGLFPRSIKLSARAVAWREAEVLNWCFSRSHSTRF